MYGELGSVIFSEPGSSVNTMGNYLPHISLGVGRNVTDLSMGAYSSCAILDNQQLKCFGYNEYGVIGSGLPGSTSLCDFDNGGDSLPAVLLGTGLTATLVRVGYYHTCAVLDNASVKCWGYNGNGELGQGNTNNIGAAANQMGDFLPAVSLGSGRSATAIGLGFYHTCALLDNASVKCWGYNVYGQLGQGSTVAIGTLPNQMGDYLPTVLLGTGRTAVAIELGDSHTCALLDNGSVKCWGANSYGQLGQGNTNNVGENANQTGDYLPVVSLGSGRTAIAIALGSYHTCALLDNASVKCWGSNDEGQLGQGNSNNIGMAANQMGDHLLTISLGTGRQLSHMCVA